MFSSQMTLWVGGKKKKQTNVVQKRLNDLQPIIFMLWRTAGIIVDTKKHNRTAIRIYMLQEKPFRIKW